jgi:hypothetical protein
MQSKILFSYPTGVYLAQNSNGQTMPTFDKDKAEQFAGITFNESLQRQISYSYI